MKKLFNVFYCGGESREFPKLACDYMIVKFKNPFYWKSKEAEQFIEEHDLEDTELYAEFTYPEDYPDSMDENPFYEELRKEIVAEAIKKGINPELLHFPWDD